MKKFREIEINPKVFVRFHEIFFKWKQIFVSSEHLTILCEINLQKKIVHWFHEISIQFDNEWYDGLHHFHE